MHNVDDCSENDSSSDDNYVVLQLAALGVTVAAYVEALRANEHVHVNPHIPLPEPTGAQWVELNLRNRLKCYDNFRMYPDAFLRLHDTLVRDHGLKSTQELGSREALAMFVWICACQQPYR